MQLSYRAGRRPHTGTMEVGAGVIGIAAAVFEPATCPDCGEDHALVATLTQLSGAIPDRMREYAAGAVLTWLADHAVEWGLRVIACASEGDEPTQKALRQQGYRAARAERIGSETVLAFTRREHE